MSGAARAWMRAAMPETNGMKETAMIDVRALDCASKASASPSGTSSQP